MSESAREHPGTDGQDGIDPPESPADSDGLRLARVLKRNHTVKKRGYAVRVVRSGGGVTETVIVSDGEKHVGEVVLHHDKLKFEVIHGGHPVMITVLRELQGYELQARKSAEMDFLYEVSSEKLHNEIPVQEAEPEEPSSEQALKSGFVESQLRKLRGLLKWLLLSCFKRQ